LHYMCQENAEKFLPHPGTEDKRQIVLSCRKSCVVTSAVLLSMSELVNAYETSLCRMMHKLLLWLIDWWYYLRNWQASNGWVALVEGKERLWG